jgi:hypothetical protein
MQRSTKKRLWFVLTGLGLLLAASVLTACTVSVSGGMAGVISALALGAALLGLGASTSGCDDSVGACLSSDVGPCLSQALDAGPDGLAPAEVGPCLQPPLPDASPDTATPDAASPDAHIGPCLSPRPPDQGVGALDPELRPEQLSPPVQRETQREQAIARLADRLPQDVAQRLGVPGGDDDSA